MSRVVVIAVVTAAIVGLPFAALVQADEVPVVREGAVDVRGFGGAGTGLSLSAWWPGARLRMDAEAAVLVATNDAGTAFMWGGIGAVVPVARRGPSFLGVRAGYDLEYFWKNDLSWQGSRVAHVPDGGLVARLESAGGSSIEGEVGAEAVLRDQSVICCDSNLPKSSLGARLALKGELALSPTWALLAQLGLRTAAHILEIKFLPIASVGIRARF